MTASKTPSAGRVRSGGRGPRKELRRGRTGDDGKRKSVEKIAAGDSVHGTNLTAAGRARECSGAGGACWPALRSKPARHQRSPEESVGVTFLACLASHALSAAS